MDNTPNLSLPLIAAAQAQKHITHNEAIGMLDDIVQLGVTTRGLSAPPLSPVDGERYIVGPTASGLWLGKDSFVAVWQAGAWSFLAPRTGWVCWVADESKLYAFDGIGWNDILSTGAVNPVAFVGINATADVANRLSVSSAAILFNHEGAGHQLKVNKNTTTDTGSLVFQTGFSGRAEMGLAGDDNYHLKVSPDGASWVEAMLVDATSGFVSFPGGSAAPTPPSMQVMTSSGTWTKPAGCQSVRVSAVGGGGAGGGCNSGGGGTGAGGGGAGGGAAIEYIDVSALSSVSVTIGQGGVAAAGVSGGNGGTTSFGAYCSASGGGGGGYAGPSSGGAGGSPGIGSGAQINGAGGWGSSGSYVSGALIAGGIGGSNMFGGGGAGGAGGYPARPGTGNGGGGGGGGAEALTGAGSTAGGAGASGIIIIEEYY